VRRNGSAIAAAKTTIITTITTRFASDIWKKCQCTTVRRMVEIDDCAE